MKMLFILAFSIFHANAQHCNRFNEDIRKYGSCSDKSVHLTFDDGPNTTTTPKVVETLKRQGVDATFFISTHQLTKGDLSKKKEIVKDIVSSGFTLASHGHDHNCHDIRYDWKGNLQDGYSDKERRSQVSKSVDLLDQFSDGQFSKQKNTLIRFPYGRGISPSPKEINKMIASGRDIRGSTYSEQLQYYREHSPAMNIASEYKLSHIGWNHDSKDATTKFGAKNTDEYIDFQIKSFCNSSAKNIMTLYHDTRAINSMPSNVDPTKTVLDELIERSKCLGITFISMNEILKKNLQNGVYTKSYNSINKVEDMLSQLDSVETKITKSCQLKEDTSFEYNSCFSDYVGEVKHCDGKESYCIDGTWIKSKDIRDLTCTNKIDISVAINLSQKYLAKSCSTPSKRISLGANQVSCYCQLNSDDKLTWNCFDITSGLAKVIN